MAQARPHHRRHQQGQPNPQPAGQPAVIEEIEVIEKSTNQKSINQQIQNGRRKFFQREPQLEKDFH
jgi:hypothetical protein